MHQPARLRNHYRKALSPAQRRNRWLLYLAGVLLIVGVNRCAVSCRSRAPIEQKGVLARR
jgi:hypothetical protein